MVYLKYNCILNHPWLVSQLEKKSVAEFVAETGIPYNSVTNQINQMPEKMRVRVNRGRLSWSEADKRLILELAEEQGHSNIAKLYGIAPAMLSRWRRELGLMNTRPLKRGRPAKDKFDLERA